MRLPENAKPCLRQPCMHTGPGSPAAQRTSPPSPLRLVSGHLGLPARGQAGDQWAGTSRPGPRLAQFQGKCMRIVCPTDPSLLLPRASLHRRSPTRTLAIDTEQLLPWEAPQSTAMQQAISLASHLANNSSGRIVGPSNAKLGCRGRQATAAEPHCAHM